MPWHLAKLSNQRNAARATDSSLPLLLSVMANGSQDLKLKMEKIAARNNSLMREGSNKGVQMTTSKK